MQDLTLTGAEVLRPEGVSDAPLALSDGRVVERPAGRAVDLSGFRVLPGIVDMHGDGFERHLAPRRGAMKDLSQGLISAEAELAANGITTAMLAQFWSWEGGMRSKEFALRFLEALRSYRSIGTDLRVQLRFEYALLEDYPAFLETVQKYAVDYVVFNDHLPHAALAKGKKPPRLTGQALKSGRSPEAHLEMLKALHNRQAEAEQAVTGLAADLAGQGVRLGSHDDDTAEVRQGWQARGVAISEFPETQEAADSATAGVVLGAPNVVRGGSHSGNVSAVDLLREGIGDALASDYHYPAPKQAALLLSEELGLAAAWALVSKRPAALLGLTDRGDLAPGKRADLVVLDEAGRIGATLAGGHVTHLSGAVAARFMA